MDWTRGKTPKEVKEVYDKRTEDLKDDVYYWERRNFEHRLTIENTSEEVKLERIDRHIKSYSNNRKNHKNYRPIIVRVEEPGKTPYIFKYESERDFFSKTHLEATTLVRLKKTGSHTIKRILPSSKHTFAKGTVFTMLYELD